MAFVKKVLVGKLHPKIWICCLCVVCILIGTLQAAAQVRPPRRKHRIMVDPSAKKKQNTRKVDIGESLKDIAKRATQHTQNPKVDVVFVVDVSQQMFAPVAVLEKRLIDMVAVIEAKTMDYRFALVSFKSVRGEPRYIFHQWTFDYIGIENAVRETRVETDISESGYGLDAIMKGLNELDFREKVTTQFVVISNSRMRTSWTEAKCRR